MTNDPNTAKSTASGAPATADARAPADRFDVVVIGAGQAGLAIGYLKSPPGPTIDSPTPPTLRRWRTRKRESES